MSIKYSGRILSPTLYADIIEKTYILYVIGWNVWFVFISTEQSHKELKNTKEHSLINEGYAKNV